MTCNYCGGKAILVNGKRIYPWEGLKKVWKKKFWLCSPCDAYVGCHPGGDRRLGTLANKPLRSLRIRCHEQFDKLWKSGPMKRQYAYIWLQDKMGLQPEQAHIGKFDEEQCLKLLEILK